MAHQNFQLEHYDLLNLRDAYHHLVSFHDANYKFMHKLYAELMAVNKRCNGIDNLHAINKKLENEQANGLYFGYTEFTQISMIQCLNHLHWICTFKFIHHRCSHSKRRDNGGKIEQIKDRNGKKSKYAFHHKFKIGNNSVDAKKSRVGSVPNFDVEIEREHVEKFQTIIKPRPFRKREQKVDDDVLSPNENKKTRKGKDKRSGSESIRLLKQEYKASKWQQPLSSLDEEEDVDAPFDLTNFDVSILESDSEEEMKLC